jgi:hypothetical protein
MHPGKVDLFLVLFTILSHQQDNKQTTNPSTLPLPYQ